MTYSSIWVADQPFVERATFHRQNFAVVGDIAPEILARGYSAAFSLADGAGPDDINFDQELCFYHVRSEALLRTGKSIGSQGVQPNDVLVLIPAVGEGAVLLAAMVRQTQGFPIQIEKLPAHMGTATMNDIDKRDQASAISNTVTVNLGAGAQFIGSVNVGRDIQQAVSAAHETSAEDLRLKLEDLVRQVAKLVEALPDEEAKNETAQQLTTFVEQAKKETPSKRLLKVTAEGLIDAAKSVASFAAPIAVAVKAVLSILGVAG